MYIIAMEVLVQHKNTTIFNRFILSETEFILLNASFHHTAISLILAL